MAGMTAEQAMFVNGMYIDAVKRESKATRDVIAAVPPNECEYKPDDCSKTAIELARHIAAAESRLLSIPIAGSFDPKGPSPLPESAKTPAEIAAWYEQSTVDTLSKLSKLTPEQLTKIVDFRGLFQMPAVMYLQFALHHSIHHRGQLSAYLRAMGGKVPAIYGESYDSAAAKKAAGG
ncbi:MAG TPA: DinB family protein [Candidatus Acidoferrum sp.]|nr:DinB family protein [Candidatus Acidoferrum sp.]